MIVLWDGTPNRPLGRMLFAEEGQVSTVTEVRHTYERRESQRGHRTGSFAKVRAVLPQIHGWFEPREMASKARISLQQARCALYACWEHGVLEKSEARPMRYRVKG